MVWAGYRAKLNHLVLSVLDGVEGNVPAFRVDVGYCSLGVAICCRMHPSLYRGLGSCRDCSLMRSCKWYNCCMKKFSHIFMRLPLWQGCNICKVYWEGPYSCWLFSMCIAWAEWKVLVRMYRKCCQYLMAMERPDWLLASCTFQAIYATAVGRGMVRLL
jgi:hypothetical protein